MTADIYINDHWTYMVTKQSDYQIMPL
jgi:hypothetical protein